MKGAKEYPYKSLHRYPGMRPYDVAIWDQFILTNPGVFKRVWYNVPVGDPCGCDHDHAEGEHNGYNGVTSWRADVVADDGEFIYTIEIKPNALGGAIGQALSYSVLLPKYNVLDKPVKPVVITDDIAPITLEAASLLGVALLAG